MELTFLWIEHFRKFNRQAFNFSPEITATVTSIGEQRYKLDLDLNPDFTNPFKLPTVQISGIAGRNGAGKSTLLSCLKMLYGNLEILIAPLIFCHLDRENNILHTHYFNGGGNTMLPLNVEIGISDSLGNKYQVKQATPYYLTNFGDNRITGLGTELKKIDCGFLTGNFDYTPETYYSGIINLSTKYRVDDFLNEYVKKVERDTEKKIRDKAQRKTPVIEIFPSHLQDYYKKEFQSHFRLIAYTNGRVRNLLPDLPKKVVISFNFQDYQSLLDDQNSKGYLFHKGELKEIQEQALLQLRQISDRRLVFQNLIYLCVFYNAVRYDLFGEEGNSYTNGDLAGLITKIAKSQDVFSEIESSLNELKITTIDTVEASKLRDLLGDKLNSAIEKAPFVDDPVYKNQIIQFPFTVGPNVWNLLSQVFDYQYGNETAFLEYTWEHDLSTGEQARLNNFARLYELRKKMQNKFLLLLIDEGDLYYHPQWQKQYVKELLDAIKFFFEGRRLQVILTTHSPFILSDIPKQNIIFLNRIEQDVENVSCEVSPSIDHIETFGANIHELFMDSFFLQDGLMGEFARNYIDELIKEIKPLENISREFFEANLRQRINIIGDQFIKAKVLEMVASRVEADTVDKIIQDRSQELNVLKAIRDQKRKQQ